MKYFVLLISLALSTALPRPELNMLLPDVRHFDINPEVLTEIFNMNKNLENDELKVKFVEAAPMNGPEKIQLFAVDAQPELPFLLPENEYLDTFLEKNHIEQLPPGQMLRNESPEPNMLIESLLDQINNALVLNDRVNSDEIIPNSGPVIQMESEPELADPLSDISPDISVLNELNLLSEKDDQLDFEKNILIPMSAPVDEESRLVDQIRQADWGISHVNQDIVNIIDNMPLLPVYEFN